MRYQLYRKLTWFWDFSDHLADQMPKHCFWNCPLLIICHITSISLLFVFQFIFTIRQKNSYLCFDFFLDLYLLHYYCYVVSVVNDVALARTIASPLLLKVAKISLDKASSSQHWRKKELWKDTNQTEFIAAIQNVLYLSQVFMRSVYLSAVNFCIILKVIYLFIQS